jgi:hypothetical protein
LIVALFFGDIVWLLVKAVLTSFQKIGVCCFFLVRVVPATSKVSRTRKRDANMRNGYAAIVPLHLAGNGVVSV